MNSRPRGVRAAAIRRFACTFGVRVAAIQRTDTHGKGNIVGRFARLQLKVFNRRLTKAENA
jgi:hypothetical protein